MPFTVGHRSPAAGKRVALIFRASSLSFIFWPAFVRRHLSDILVAIGVPIVNLFSMKMESCPDRKTSLMITHFFPG
jgi:hypothetical protein